MLFNVKLFLANWDSVNANATQKRKLQRRLHSALKYGEGVVFNAASVFDNSQALDLFTNDNFKKLLERCQNERGKCNLIEIRGVEGSNFIEHYNNRNDSFIFSSVGGKPKWEIKGKEAEDILLERLNKLDTALKGKAIYSPLPSQKSGVQRNMGKYILSTLNMWKGIGSKITLDNEISLSVDGLLQIKWEGMNRSNAYNEIDKFVEDTFGVNKVDMAKKIKSSLVDPAYHGLFVEEGEVVVSGDFDILTEAAEQALLTSKEIRYAVGEMWAALRSNNPNLANILLNLREFMPHILFIFRVVAGDNFRKMICEEALSVLIKERINMVAADAWITGYNALQKRAGIQRFTGYDNNLAEHALLAGEAQGREIYGVVSLIVNSASDGSICVDMIEAGDAIISGDSLSDVNRNETMLGPGDAVDLLRGSERMKNEVVYENPWFRVIKSGRWHWIDEPKSINGAVVMPIIEGRKVILVEVSRPAQNGACLELPRGYGEEGEDATSCALRELKEETGYLANSQDCVLLGTVSPNSAILSSLISMVYVDVKNQDAIGRDNEARVVKVVEKAQFEEAIRTGAITDGFTLAAYAQMVVSGKW